MQGAVRLLSQDKVYSNIVELNANNYKSLEDDVRDDAKLQNEIWTTGHK